MRDVKPIGNLSLALALCLLACVSAAALLHFWNEPLRADAPARPSLAAQDQVPAETPTSNSAESEAEERKVVAFTHGTMVKGTAISARAIIAGDFMLAHAWLREGASDKNLLADPAFSKEGESFPGREGATHTWESVTANDKNRFEDQTYAGAWFSWTPGVSGWYELRAVGHAQAIVDGAFRVGDPYGNGSVRLPVKLNEGSVILLRCARGRLSAALHPVEAGVYLMPQDATLPDVTDEGDYYGALLVACAGDADAALKPDFSFELLDSKGKVIMNARPWSDDGFWLANRMPIPGTFQKIPFKLPLVFRSEPEKLTLRARSLHDDSKAATDFQISYVLPDANRKVTFFSDLDRSVQYYGLRQALNYMEPQALVLTLHGASVEAISQSNAYASKSWANIVAPTNRRPYGFDWEDWGRIDAIEVLAHARETLNIDPSRQYLTGHSMGGHGTWNVAAHLPDQFAAIAPSAGWCDFWTYASGVRYKESTLTAWLRRAEAGSRTLELKNNYRDMGIYILHGDADDNVPVTEARAMSEALKDHQDLRWHEEPGAGHWWDKPGPGAACVDWQLIFDMFQRRRLPVSSEVNDIDFTTMNPEDSSSCHWVTIDTQIEPRKPSRIQALRVAETHEISLTTTNVERFGIHREKLLGNTSWQNTDLMKVRIDGSEALTLDLTQHLGGSDDYVYFARGDDGTWARHTGFFKNSEKTRHQSGGFKSAFMKNPLLVYGTAGSAEENAWALARAIQDSEEYWYRGNATLPIISDVEYLKRWETASKQATLNTHTPILYGNADTNAAWKIHLQHAPIQVTRSELKAGGTTITSSQIGGVFVYHRNAGRGIIAAVTGTGITGMRLTQPMRFFLAGAGVPDFTFVDGQMLTSPSDGLVLTGYFDNNWKLDDSLLAWCEEATLVAE